MNRQLSMPFLRLLHPVKRGALMRRIAPEWREQAACATAKDPDAWFPDPATPLAEAAEPLAACTACPVRRSCVATALLGNEIGIWAGTTPADRRSALHRLAAGAATDLVLDQLLYKARRRAKEIA